MGGAKLETFQYVAITDIESLNQGSGTTNCLGVAIENRTARCALHIPTESKNEKRTGEAAEGPCEKVEGLQG